MAVLLLVLFLSRLVVFGHVSSIGSGRTMNCTSEVITRGLAPMPENSKVTMERAACTHRGMAQAASDVKHATTTEYKARTSVGSAFDEEKMDYENAKRSVGEAYQTAKKTMIESAKKEYEKAKEKASKAAGDLGAKIRKGTEEL